VRVYAGIDPVTMKRHYLTEVVPVGPSAAEGAEKARSRLLTQVDEQRTRATVNQLLDWYFELLRVESTTREDYEALARPTSGRCSVACRSAASTMRSCPDPRLPTDEQAAAIAIEGMARSRVGHVRLARNGRVRRFAELAASSWRNSLRGSGRTCRRPLTVGSARP